MHRLRRLWLRAFRNYGRADLAIGPGTTVFLGANGQGKSNLLEAIYVAATGRSHRTPQEAEMIRFGEAAARVRVLVTRRGREEEIETTLAVSDGRTTVQMRVNGAVTPRGSVLGRLPVVMAAPWDLEVVRGAAAGRRRLLDAALAQLSPSYYFALHRYHRVIAQRNAVLRQGRGVGLEPWDAQMVALGARIAGHRRRHAAHLAAPAAEWFGRLGGTGTLGLLYRAAWEGTTEEDITAGARAQMARHRADELRRGVTLTGPHRDDVDLLLDGRALRSFGSQGQWRTAMLAVRLAERAAMTAELEGPPVLLLDDALAEIDQGRQRRVLGLGDEGQVLLTTTDLPPEAPTVRGFVVEAGTVRDREWSPRSAIS